MKRKSKKRSKQYSFIPSLKDVFIGLARGTHAKSHRPLHSKKPIHICFRSKFASGKRTMLGLNKLKVQRLVDSISKSFGVKILKYANVGNHIHLVVRLPGSISTAQRQYAKWIRLLTSRIAFEVGGSKKGRPFRDQDGNKIKFWDAIPFSRVIHGRRGWRGIDRYILKNEFEAQGIPKQTAIRMAAELYASANVLDLPNWKSSA